MGGPGDIPDGTGTRKVLTCLCCTTIFVEVAAKTKKDSTSEQVMRWAFIVIFVPYGLSKIIIVDADGVFSGVLKSYFKNFFVYQ